MTITQMYNPMKQNKKLKELDKLEDMLKAKKIPHKRVDREGTERFDYYDMRHQIFVFSDERWTKPLWSAICCKLSYGYDLGLIEMMDMKDFKVEGYMKAEDAMDVIKQTGELMNV